MTYSIIGRDPADGAVGAAVQSKFPGVGSIVLHGRAGVGCITTQAFANPRHGDDGLDSLAAGRDTGGELRGQQSAALLVVKPGGGYGGYSGRHVDISVYDHAEPIHELARCYRLHRLSYFPSDSDQLMPVDAALARELKAIMRRAGFRDLPDGPDWGETEIALLRRFMGVENYDNRLRDDALIDAEVLADLRRRYPPAE